MNETFNCPVCLRTIKTKKMISVNMCMNHQVCIVCYNSLLKNGARNDFVYCPVCRNDTLFREPERPRFMYDIYKNLPSERQN